MRVQGTDAFSLSSMSSRHISRKSAPRSGTSTTVQLLQHIPAGTCRARVGVVEQVCGHHRGRCFGEIEDPWQVRNPERQVAVRRTRGRSEAPCQAPESFKTDVGVQSLSPRHQVEIPGQCRKPGCHNRHFRGNFRQIGGKDAQALDSRARLTGAQNTDQPFDVLQSATEPRQSGRRDPARFLAAQERERCPRRIRRKRPSDLRRANPGLFFHDPSMADLVSVQPSFTCKDAHPLYADAHASRRFLRRHLPH